MVDGPRQAGKSTLVRELAVGGHRADYVTLDDAIDLAAATADPEAFVADRPRTLVIDEDLGDRFARGVVLYAGERTVPFGDRISEVPISALWTAR